VFVKNNEAKKKKYALQGQSIQYSDAKNFTHLRRDGLLAGN